MKSDIGIIGGGLAGLSLACLLAGQGHAITVYEQDRPGGKLRRETLTDTPSGPLTFDTGPSLFTFPEVWRTLLARLGEPDPLDLRPLPGGLGLHHTPHGSLPLPVPPGHPLHAEWVRYAQAAAPLRPHLLTLLTTPPRLTDPHFLRASHALLRVVGRHSSAQSWLDALRLPPPLAHALATQALNAGRPPQQAPALYALLPALIGAEVYRPRQGMGAVLGALLAFARARGVGVRGGAGVRRVVGHTLTLDGGEQVRHTLLVSAVDPQRLSVLRGQPGPSPLARRTVSGLALYTARPAGLALPATSVLPPTDFGAFAHSLRTGDLPADTLTLVHADGPRLALLLTVPALSRDLTLGHPWVQAQVRRVAEVLEAPEVLNALDQPWIGLSPRHYAAGGHPGGAIYGAAAALWRGGPLHLQPYRLGPGLWQVGTGVHPGGGLPAIFGGALIVDRLLRERGR